MKLVQSAERATEVARSQAEFGSERALDRSPEVFRKAAIDSLNTLFNRIDNTALDEAIQALADARRVAITGANGDSCGTAPLLYAGLTWFRDWTYYDHRRDGAARVIFDLEAGDALVAIATAPYNPHILLTACYVRESGARVIGITDTPQSPLNRSAHDVLLTPVPTPGVFKSHVATTALVEMLVMMAAARSVSGD